MTERTSPGWSRVVLLVLLAGTPVVAQDEPQVPSQVQVLCEHLDSLQHPLEYSVLLETRVIKATDEPGAEGTANRVFSSWVDAVLAGVPPDHGEVWPFSLDSIPFRTASTEGGFQGGLRWIDYAQSVDAWLNISRSTEGYVQASLRRRGLSLTYRKSADPSLPDRVSVFTRKEERPGHFCDPHEVVSPLNPEPYYFDLLRGGDWKEVRASPWTTLHMESPPDTGNSLTLCYREGDDLPRVALDVLVADPETRDTRYVLSFFNRSSAHAVASNPLRVYEVLRIDSLAFEGKILVERVIVYGGRSLATGVADSEAEEVFTLPVQWSERTELRDARSPESTKVYGPDVTTWPPELLEVMRPW